MNFPIIQVELYEAIKRHDITAAEIVCSRAKSNINFSDTLIFVVENNMDAMFNMLKRYGAPFEFYSEFSLDLISVIDCYNQTKFWPIYKFIKCWNQKKYDRSSECYPNFVACFSWDIP